MIPEPAGAPASQYGQTVTSTGRSTKPTTQTVRAKDLIAGDIMLVAFDEDLRDCRRVTGVEISGADVFVRSDAGSYRHAAGDFVEIAARA